MPFSRWLRSLIANKPPQTGGPPPPGGEGWGGGLSLTPSPPPAPRGGAEAPTPDHSHRLHTAANDPAFSAKRETAIALICQAITDIATPLGYTRKGTTWARATPRGKSAIHLQRSRYGFTADINLRFLTPDGTSPTHGLWAQHYDIRLQHFHLPTEDMGPKDGVITYLDVIENPDCLTDPLHILATRALPWLEAHHTDRAPPEIEAYLPR